MDALEFFLKATAIVGVITGAIVTVVRSIIWAHNVISSVESLEKSRAEDKKQLNFLKTKILRTLDSIRDENRQHQQTNDRRMDRVEKKVNYLFGRTKVTIPPKD